jgi:hypothetical protein
MEPLDSRHHAFQLAYRALEQKMKVLAEEDGMVFLPNPSPGGPADYVLICMEPSLGRWATSEGQARERVEAGFRNFLSSIEDFIVHLCARTYLCGPGQHYHVTDLSKGAMPVEAARAAREQRYAKWYPLLLEEIELVAARNAGFVAVGAIVAQQLRQRGFGRPVVPVIHYSGQAARARSVGIAGRESSFEAFRETVSLQDILATAEVVLRSSHIPAAIRDGTLARLAKGQLTTSRKQLIFNYKIAFESFRSRVPSGRV